MANRMGNLHGGCAATIVDNLSTTILIGVSRPGAFQYGGVSRNLNVTYLRPVPLDAEIRVICEVVQVGRRLALLKAEIRRVDNDDLCVIADHQKANTDPESDRKL
jgi:acyl-coenzyme A thioesterase 13